MFSAFFWLPLAAAEPGAPLLLLVARACGVCADAAKEREEEEEGVIFSKLSALGKVVLLLDG